MVGVFGQELRAVVMVETGMVVDDSLTGLSKRREKVCCEPCDGVGELCGHSAV